MTRCEHHAVGYDGWGTIHCIDCHRTLRCWVANRLYRPQDHPRLWRWPLTVKENCVRCRWVYYIGDPDDNAHLHQERE